MHEISSLPYQITATDNGQIRISKFEAFLHDQQEIKELPMNCD
jgi:hypothetical protein